MISRRNFVLKGTALAGLPLVAPIASVLLSSDELTATNEDEDEVEIDPNGSLIAVALEAVGTISLSEILHNRLLQQKFFDLNDTSQMMAFVSQSGLSRIVFVGWAAGSGIDVPAEELLFDHVEGNIPSDLLTRFMECASALTPPLSER